MKDWRESSSSAFARSRARQGVYNSDDMPPLIAAVEALRERVVELEKDLAEEESDVEHYLRLAIVDPGAIDQISWQDRAEVAEARVVELAGALERIRQRCLFEEDDGRTGVTTEPHIDEQLFNDICAVLSTTPAKAKA